MLNILNRHNQRKGVAPRGIVGIKGFALSLDRNFVKSSLVKTPSNCNDTITVSKITLDIRYICIEPIFKHCTHAFAVIRDSKKYHFS